MDTESSIRTDGGKQRGRKMDGRTQTHRNSNNKAETEQKADRQDMRHEDGHREEDVFSQIVAIP